MEKNEALEKIDYLKTLIEKTNTTAFESYPYLILWGILWMIGYVLTIWLPDGIWAIIGIVGGLSSMLIGRYFPWKENADFRMLTKLMLQGLLIVIIFFTIPRMYGNPSLKAEMGLMLWPVMIGFVYISYGLMLGKELIYVGCALILTAIMGIYIEGAYKNLWYAFACGGLLVAAGLNFRRKVKTNGDKSK